MDTQDLELFERSLRHAAEDAADGPALDSALAELGWAEALADFPRPAISALFTVQGETNATSSALARVMAWALTRSHDAPGALLPPLGTWTPPGRVVGAHTEVSGLANVALLAAGQITVPVTTTTGVGHIALDGAELDAQPVSGLDPEADLVLVTGTGPVPAEDVAEGVGEGASGNWEEAVRLGRLAVGHELVGASRAVLDQAREHALERIQFGQPIARFQAVRHKLAEILIAVETAEALLDAAWQDRTPVTAAMAVAAAGRGAHLAARHGQQVLAGIGFTAEHGLHRWVRRILVLDEILGSSRTLTKDLGRDLLATRTLPPLLPL